MPYTYTPEYSTAEKRTKCRRCGRRFGVNWKKGTERKRTPAVCAYCFANTERAKRDNDEKRKANRLL